MSSEGTDYETWGRLAYEAYATTTGGRTYDGRPMPTWADLGEPIQCAWNAAAQAVRFATQMRMRDLRKEAL